MATSYTKKNGFQQNANSGVDKLQFNCKATLPANTNWWLEWEDYATQRKGYLAVSTGAGGVITTCAGGVEGKFKYSGNVLYVISDDIAIRYHQGPSIMWEPASSIPVGASDITVKESGISVQKVTEAPAAGTPKEVISILLVD